MGPFASRSFGEAVKKAGKMTMAPFVGEGVEEVQATDSRQLEPT